MLKSNRFLGEITCFTLVCKLLLLISLFVKNIPVFMSHMFQLFTKDSDEGRGEKEEEEEEEEVVSHVQEDEEEQEASASSMQTAQTATPTQQTIGQRRSKKPREKRREITEVLEDIL